MTIGHAVSASRGSKASPAARRKLAAILGAKSRKHRKEYLRFSEELEAFLGATDQTTLSKAGLKALRRLHAALDGVRDDIAAVKDGGDERRTLLEAFDRGGDAYDVLESALRRPLSPTSVAQVTAASHTLRVASAAFKPVWRRLG